MTHLDLFSGIGGFALAAKWCWGDEYVPLAHSDVEDFACKIYHRHFPESECLGDITKIDWREWLASYSEKPGFIRAQKQKDDGANSEGGGRYDPSDKNSNTLCGGGGGKAVRPITVDLLTGGFPCQPFSLAGKRKGKEDDRALWHEMFRAIREIRPRWVVGENVAGLINMGLDEVLSDLEGEGYATETFVIPACATNAPHRRDRVWIVANAGYENCKRGRMGVRGFSPNDSAEVPVGRIDVRGSARSDYKPEILGDAPDTDSQGLQGWEGERLVGREEQGVLRARTSKGDAWGSGWYEVATAFCRVDDGLPRQLDRSARLKALGNAIVPQVVYEIFKAIREIDG